MTSTNQFCCPQCKGSLEVRASAYTCMSCDKTYPIFCGIPDFRVFVGPYADDEHTYKEDDYRHAMPLIEEFERKDFAALLLQYLKAAGVQGERFTRMYQNTLSMTDRAVADLQEIETHTRTHHPQKFKSVVEIGCGSGSFLIAASDKAQQVIGVDMAMRWLILAKKRLTELGLDVPLVCCYAEYLPFKENSFDLIVAEDVIEHVKLQEGMLRECHRVISSDGVLYLKYPNRFSIAPEPHVRVWGVGFLPRSWMNGYVRKIAGVPYKDTRLLSFFETKRLLRRSSFSDNEVLIPSIPESELKHFSKLRRLGVTVYDFTRKNTFSRALLYLVGPFFHVIAYANKDSSNNRHSPS